VYNYTDINDVEFEELCKDIMEVKLGTSLRTFSSGRDGGVDFTDNVITHNIIVQVKHYNKSNFSSLMSSLKKEVEKVHKLNPNQYYICVSKSLTDANIKEIYALFAEYMESDRNIVTIKEIDDFLQNEKNVDIVRKHFKLWLHASNILNEILNQDIFIDCDVLLHDIDEQSKFFVPTGVYYQCIDHLDKNGLLMITGGPGVGKTITSKMLILYYATQGYRVRYTTNGDIANLKQALSSDKTSKEIVLLDDCLGQIYFKIKDTQESELLTLIKYIKASKNKKMILNSRITIFNEAKERFGEFRIYFQEKKIRNFTINMDEITYLEKAKIFYNHLVYKHINEEYYKNIKENRHYLEIVKHRNYTPRIIEYVTYESNYLKVEPSEFANYILWNLSNPNDIWKNEFDRRLTSLDRVFMSTLYSLTDTNIERGILKKCFEKRLLSMKDVDCTIDEFGAIIARLNQSIINVVDKRDHMHIGVINPSVNDYMKSVFEINRLELTKVRNSICNYKQVERCFTNKELPNYFLDLLRTEQIDDIEFKSETEKDYFITAHICKFGIENHRYIENVFDYLTSAYACCTSRNDWLGHVHILNNLTSTPLGSFYLVNDFLTSEENVSLMFQDSMIDLDDTIEIVNTLIDFYNSFSTPYSWFIDLAKKVIEDTMTTYLENLETSDYCDAHSIDRIIDQNSITYCDRYGEIIHGEIDKDSIIEDLENLVIEDIEEEIFEKLSFIKIDTLRCISFSISEKINNGGIRSYVDSYFEQDDSDYEHYESGTSADTSISEIEAIFER